MSAPAVRDWVVLYKPRPAVPFVVWVWISDVPKGTTRDAVTDALEAATWWRQWEARRTLRSVLMVKPASSMHAGMTIGATRIVAWDELAPAVRRLTLDVDGSVYAQAVKAAAAEGWSLSEWVRAAITGALEVEGAGA